MGICWMENREQEIFDRLLMIAPIFRGLLAEPSDSPDVPFQPGILKSVIDERAIKLASSKNSADGFDSIQELPPLLNSPFYPGNIRYEALPEEIRKNLKDEIAAYSKEHGALPEVICLPDTGILYRGEGSKTADLPLSSKVALVTGAAGAIGYGVCRGLLEQGCHLAVSDLAGEQLDKFVEDLVKIQGDRVMGVPLDVTDPSSVSQGFGEVVRAWGGLDIIVHNAGIAHVAFLKEMELEDFRKLERVNVDGTMLILSEAGRFFERQAIGGDIVLMSTKNVSSPGAGFGAYSATKASSHQLGRIASLEMAQYGVRVNMVAPDAVFSEGKYQSGLWRKIGPGRMKARGLDEEGLQEYYRNRNLLKAKVTGRHVANAVLFFVTRQTPTTGATLPVDGGLPDAVPRM